MIIGHLDMDCFFCACEVKKDPLLKGKPVIVGSTGDRGVVSASSYEARKFGVYSATPITKARKLCPEGIFLPVDFSLYHKESESIMGILGQLADRIEQVSVDEAYLDLSEYSNKFKDIETMARFIQILILKKTSLTCSIGISNSRYVSKIASDYMKPNGITIVEDAKIFLKDLPIEKIPGIGKVSKEHYNNNGIFKIGDLTEFDKFTLIKKFGKSGIFFQKVANGEDNSGLMEYGPQKSVSREWTFQKDIDDENTILKNLKGLCHEIISDLDNKSFRKISIKLRYRGFITITKDRSLFAHTKSNKILEENILDLFKTCQKGKIRLIGIRVSDLSNETQTTLVKYLKI